MIYDESGAAKHSGGKTFGLSKSASRSIIYSYGKSSWSLSHTIHRNSWWTVDLHMKDKAIKFWDDNIEKHTLW